MSTDTTVQWLLDRALISELLYSFAASLDCKNWKQYAENFADGGYIELPDPQSTSGATFVIRKQNMLEMLPKSLGRYHATHHISSNHQIVIDRDEASSRSYLQAVHVGVRPFDHWSAGGWYDSQYRRAAQGWKFTRVKLTAIWQEGEIKAINPDA